MRRQTVWAVTAVGVALLGVAAFRAQGGSRTESPPTPGATGSASSGGADEDVAVASCGLSSDDQKGPSATLSVANRSSTKPPSYVITVAFETKDGKRLDTADAAVQNLAPGETATPEATSSKVALRSTPFGCKVLSVNRTAAP